MAERNAIECEGHFCKCITTSGTGKLKLAFSSLPPLSLHALDNNLPVLDSVSIVERIPVDGCYSYRTTDSCQFVTITC